MTDLVAANYPSNAARTNAEMKVVLDGFRDILAEHLGGAARTELTIASGLIVPAAGTGGGTHTVDTEGNAASDDLTNMTTTNVPEGRYIRLYAENAARVVTIKDSSGGAGQFLLADGNDFVFASIDAWVLFQRRSTDLIEVARYVPADDRTTVSTLEDTDLLEVWDDSANAYRSVSAVDAREQLALPKACAFYATPTSDQTALVPGGYTDITFGTEVFDYGSNFASSQFTVPETGVYSLGAAVHSGTSMADGNRYNLRIVKTTGAILGTQGDARGATGVISSTIAIPAVLLTAGDIIKVQMLHDNSGNIDLDAVSTTAVMYFCGARIA